MASVYSHVDSQHVHLTRVRPSAPKGVSLVNRRQPHILLVLILILALAAALLGLIDAHLPDGWIWDE